jgi:outer membrane immunogenic protein
LVKKIIAISAISTLAIVAAPAAAQTITAPSGARAEAIVGYDRPRIEIQGFEDLKEEGAVYGAGVGYDFAMGPSMALGVDAEISGSTAKWEEGTAELSFGRDLYAGARMSLPLSSTSNVYLKGGYTNLQVRGKIGGVGESENLDGWRIGAGGQFGLGGRAYVGGEVRYSDYEQDVSRTQLALTVGTRF